VRMGAPIQCIICRSCTCTPHWFRFLSGPAAAAACISRPSNCSTTACQPPPHQRSARRLLTGKQSMYRVPAPRISCSTRLQVPDLSPTWCRRYSRQYVATTPLGLCHHYASTRGEAESKTVSLPLRTEEGLKKYRFASLPYGRTDALV
jgi:hypothetical protein